MSPTGAVRLSAAPLPDGSDRRAPPDPLPRPPCCRAALSPRTAPGTALPNTGRCSPALASCQPAPARPDPRAARRHRAFRCVTPTDRRTGCPGYLRAVLQSLFQEELVHGGHVGAASRRSRGRSGVRGAGTPRRRGSAASVPPSLRPAGAAPALCRHRARLDGSAGGRGRSLRPVPVRWRKRVTGREASCRH